MKERLRVSEILAGLQDIGEYILILEFMLTYAGLRRGAIDRCYYPYGQTGEYTARRERIEALLKASGMNYHLDSSTDGVFTRKDIFYSTGKLDIKEANPEFLDYPDCCWGFDNNEHADKIMKDIEESKKAGKDYSHLMFISYMPHDIDCPDTKELGEKYMEFIQKLCPPLVEKMLGEFNQTLQ